MVAVLEKESVVKCSATKGEKPRRELFSFYGFLEDHSKFTYAVRSFLEGGFHIKKRAVCSELSIKTDVLDIACGGGFLSTVIPEQNYLGIDLSPAVIAHARKTQKGIFIPMSATAMAFRNSTFRSCVAMDVFHHIEDCYIDPILSEVSRVMTADARFLVTDPVRSVWYRDPLNSTLQRLDRGNCFRTPDELLVHFDRFFHVEKHYITRSGFIRWMVFVLSRK